MALRRMLERRSLGCVARILDMGGGGGCSASDLSCTRVFMFIDGVKVGLMCVRARACVCMCVCARIN